MKNRTEKVLAGNNIRCNEWLPELPRGLGKLQPTSTTTPAPISEYIARDNNEQFYSVHWDCAQNLFRIERVQSGYAEDALAETLSFRGVNHFLELFGEDVPNDDKQSTCRLDRIEEMLKQLVESPKKKECYTTAEVASILDKAEFTVREWCRNGRIYAEKRSCGRGPSKEWSISAGELERIQNEGLLPDSNRFHIG